MLFDPMEGVSAADGKDGDLTGAVQVMGSVDTSREGTYTLTYQVSDKAGNTAVAERTVVVLAEETPGTGRRSDRDDPERAGRRQGSDHSRGRKPGGDQQ